MKKQGRGKLVNRRLRLKFYTFTANRYLDLDIIIDYVEDGGDELESPDKQTNTYS